MTRESTNDEQDLLESDNENFDEPSTSSENGTKIKIPDATTQQPEQNTTDLIVPTTPNPDANCRPHLNFPSLNLYQQKKLIAQGMMDLALLSANANQLRYILDGFEESRTATGFGDIRYHYVVSIVLISISLFLQIAVAVALVFKSRYNIDNELEYVNANKIDNCIVLGILLITISNVISSAFAPATLETGRNSTYVSSFLDLMSLNFKH